MKNVRRNSRILGALALTLVCLTFVAAPTSASIEQVGLDSGIQAQDSFGDRVMSTVSSWGSDFLAFLADLGSIFAGQSGATITD